MPTLAMNKQKSKISTAKQTASRTKGDMQSFLIARLGRQEEEKERELQAMVDQVNFNAGGRPLVVENARSL